MDLQALTSPGLIFTDVGGSDGRSVLQELSRKIGESTSAIGGAELLERLLEREGLCSTGIGSGVAIPHCKIPGLEQTVLAVGISREAIDFGSLDGKPVRTFFVLASPEDHPAVHLKVLSTISRWLRAEPELASLLNARSPDEIFELLPRAKVGTGTEG